MSLGATMSAPASAWLAAVRASSFSVGSFKIFPPCTMPQWPCAMYSHRQTSVMTSSDGSSFFSSRTVCCTMPFFA